MSKVSKQRKEALAKFDKSKSYSLNEAVNIVKQITYSKFDASTTKKDTTTLTKSPDSTAAPSADAKADKPAEETKSTSPDSTQQSGN